MDINTAALQELQRQFSMMFKDGMQGAPNVELMQLANEIGTSTAKLTIPWLHQLPGFKEWIEDNGRKFEDIESDFAQLSPTLWEDSIRLYKKNLDDIQASELAQLYAPLLTELGQQWTMLKIDLISNAIIDNENCLFDNTAMFSDSHAYGDNTIDNLGTTALSHASFESAVEQMAGYQGKEGRNLKVQPTHLVVGPKLRTTAHSIVKAQRIPDSNASVDNPNQGYVQMVVSREFVANAGADNDVDAADFWMLADLSRAIKPFVGNLRAEAAALMDTDPGYIKRTGYVDFMTDGRVSYAGVLPHLAYLSRAT